MITWTALCGKNDTMQSIVHDDNVKNKHILCVLVCVSMSLYQVIIIKSRKIEFYTVWTFIVCHNYENIWMCQYILDVEKQHFFCLSVCLSDETSKWKHFIAYAWYVYKMPVFINYDKEKWCMYICVCIIS